MIRQHFLELAGEIDACGGREQRTTSAQLVYNTAQRTPVVAIQCRIDQSDLAGVDVQENPGEVLRGNPVTGEQLHEIVNIARFGRLKRAGYRRHGFDPGFVINAPTLVACLQRVNWVIP